MAAAYVGQPGIRPFDRTEKVCETLFIKREFGRVNHRSRGMGA